MEDRQIKILVLYLVDIRTYLNFLLNMRISMSLKDLFEILGFSWITVGF